MRGSFTDHFNTAVLLWWLFQMLLFSVTDRDEQENGGSGKRVPQLTQTHTHTHKRTKNNHPLRQTTTVRASESGRRRVASITHKHTATRTGKQPGNNIFSLADLAWKLELALV